MRNSLFVMALSIASAVVVSQSAQADVIKCSFTEPFVSTVYSMVQQTLTISNYATSESSEPVVTVVKNVSFQIKGPGKFELVGSDKKVLQTLTLDFKGSDGMSDILFPYSVVTNDQSGANNGIGGCFSNYLPLVIPAGNGY